MRRLTPTSTDTLRDQLAENCREGRQLLRGARRPRARPDPSRLLAKAAALDSGEPVVVHGWELPAAARRRFGPNGRVLVGADGSLTLVDQGE